MGTAIGVALLLLVVGLAFVATRPNARTRVTDRQLDRQRRAVRRPGRGAAGTGSLGGGFVQHTDDGGSVSSCGGGGGGDS